MKKNILVIDDSALVRRVLCDIINSDNNFQAIDSCRDGLEAYEVLKQKRYDAVILDVNMPRMDGLQLLEKLKKDGIKVTAVVVSTNTTENAETTIRAMELGAVDFLTKPGNIIETKGGEFRRKLLSVLNAVLYSKNYVRAPRSEAKETESRPVRAGAGKNKLVALACSTGGPKALQSVIPLLPKKLDAPMVLVQHMPVGFTKSLANRLNELSEIAVSEAEDQEVLKKGHVYIAPGGKHLEVASNSDGTHRIVLNDSPAIGGLKPCANIMYDSLMESKYDEIVCVVLTGMGADGTSGILSLSRRKRIHVIAQNAETCVVYGMPKAIAEAGLVNEVVPLNEVAKTITKNVGVM
ncbi:MAG: chemotaxis-specific protein-glutamate methyltransferase CheB [Agathobacter sp.]|nr:chemotaxis-specific protein-glutamate methyltransferase CheB [Agathobacter sp.]